MQVAHANKLFFDAYIFPNDTGKKIVPQPSTNPFQQTPSSPFYLKDPKNFSTKIEYDPKNNNYNFQQKIGNTNFGNPGSMSLDEYLQYDIQKAMRDY